MCCTWEKMKLKLATCAQGASIYTLQGDFSHLLGVLWQVTLFGEQGSVVKEKFYMFFPIRLYGLSALAMQTVIEPKVYRTKHGFPASIRSPARVFSSLKAKSISGCMGLIMSHLGDKFIKRNIGDLKQFACF